MTIQIEACVDNIESAVAAQEAGADRIELCSALLEGGLTPSYGLIRAAKNYLDIPIHVLIRPRRGDFLYSLKELEVMRNDIEFCQDLGIDAVVFGVLRQDAGINIEALEDLLLLSGSMKTTFHRAFDMLSNPVEGLESLIKLGFYKVLTSGQGSSAAESVSNLKELVEVARGRIGIIAAAGINSDNVTQIVSRTGVKEVHASARAKTNSNMFSNRPQISLSKSYFPTENEHYMLSLENLKELRKAVDKT